MYYLSDLNYETSRENIILGLIKQEKLDMVDIKYRMKLTDDEISRIINERNSIKGLYISSLTVFSNLEKDYIQILIGNWEE